MSASVIHEPHSHVGHVRLNRPEVRQLACTSSRAVALLSGRRVSNEFSPGAITNVITARSAEFATTRGPAT